VPRGPKAEKRPADAIGLPLWLARLPLGRLRKPRPAAQEMGKKGGAAPAKAVTPVRRAEIAKKAAGGRAVD
jgi:hypothetical protein